MNETPTTIRLRSLVVGAVLGAAGFWGIGWAIDARAAGRDAATQATADTSTSEMAGMEGMEGMAGMAGMEGTQATVGTGGMAPSVAITPAEIQQFGITFASAMVRPLAARVRSVGVVEVDETRLVDVTPKFAGYVERLDADFVGKAFRRGDQLVEVYSPDLVAAQEEVLLARKLKATVGSFRVPGMDAEPVDLEATARRRLELWDISDAQIEAMIKAGRPSRTLTLTAPISGVVLEKATVSGGAFVAGQTLLRLADLSEVWIDIEIREREAPLVRVGSRAAVTLAAYPGETLHGVIDLVYPTAEARTRSVRARVVIPNSDGRVRPGMFATVTITTEQQAVLSVPTDAVVRTGESSIVFVEVEGGRIQPVEAVLGATFGDFTVVQSGVQAGQRVVSAAQYLIDAEANIGAVMRSMMGMMGAGDMSGMDMSGMDMSGTDTSGMDMSGMDMAAPDTTRGN